jgi:hypothetical protein
MGWYDLFAVHHGWKSVAGVRVTQPAADTVLRRAPSITDDVLRRAPDTSGSVLRRAPDESDDLLRRW